MSGHSGTRSIYAAPMNIEMRQAFGLRVRELRKVAGYTSLRQFARVIRVDKTFLSHVENGKQSPTLDTVFKIAQGLGVTMSELLYGVDKQTGPEYDGACGTK